MKSQLVLIRFAEFQCLPYRCVLPGLTLKNSTFSPQSRFCSSHGSQNKKHLLLRTTLCDQFLKAIRNVFTTRYEIII